MNLEPLESRIAPATLFAVGQNGNLMRFESTTPDQLDLNVPITGLQPSETIAALDVRPETGELYALGLFDGPNPADSSVRIYKLDPTTGAATPVGNPFAIGQPDGTSWGFDFNPVADVLRVVNVAGNVNFRVSPTTGATITVDTNLDDPNSANDSIAGVAYTNNSAATTTTTLYGIDVVSDSLVRIGGIDGNPSPNNGVVTPIGPLGEILASFTGFDIAPDGTAWLAGKNLTVDRLYTVDLTTGAATQVGEIGNGLVDVRAFAVAIPRVTISADGKSATYLDVDGDRVTVKSSKGPFTQSDFVLFSVGGPDRAQLSRLWISNDAAKFVNANITITAKKMPGGDGLVNAGWIDSTTNDLGKISVAGDVGKITAGDGDNFGIALGGLKVRSLGVQGTSTQGLNAELIFDVKGECGPVKILRDVRGVEIDFSFGVASFFMGGSLVGGAEDEAGLIFATEVAGSFVIKGSVVGGAGDATGAITLSDGAKTFLIGGSILGGTGQSAGNVFVGSADSAKVGGDIRGGTGGGQFRINVAKTFTMGGSVFATDNGSFGRLDVGRVDRATIRGSIVGGNFDGDNAESIGGELDIYRAKSVVIGGSLIAGIDSSTGDIDAHGIIDIYERVDSLTIKGSVLGNATHAATINAGGEGATSPLLIGKLTVGGSVAYANILVGYEKGIGLAPNDGDGSIGAVTVGGDWIASNLVAGIEDTNGDGFGNADDVVIAMNNDPGISSRIASIVIKGSVIGTGATGDRFAFVAQQIGSVRIGGRPVPLDPMLDDSFSITPVTADVRIFEL